MVGTMLRNGLAMPCFYSWFNYTASLYTRSNHADWWSLFVSQASATFRFDNINLGCNAPTHVFHQNKPARYRTTYTSHNPDLGHLHIGIDLSN